MVLHRDLGQAVGVVAGDVADIEAAAGFGAAAQVVLVVAVGVALEEAGGVAAVGEAVELADQLRVEGPPGDGVVDGLAVALAGARDVVGRLGAALDLQRIDADLGQLRARIRWRAGPSS
jgi:hypothetical protein